MKAVLDGLIETKFGIKNAANFCPGPVTPPCEILRTTEGQLELLRLWSIIYAVVLIDVTLNNNIIYSFEVRIHGFESSISHKRGNY